MAIGYRAGNGIGIHHFVNLWRRVLHCVGLAVAKVLLRLLITTFLPSDRPVEIVVDETLERRWGRKITKRGHWRDSRQSSRQRNVTTSGLRWVVMAVIVPMPWTNQRKPMEATF